MSEVVDPRMDEKLESLKAGFRKGISKPVEERIRLLKKLKAVIRQHETQIAEALFKDLRKSPQEALITETGLVIKEIDNHLSHLKKWSRPKRVKTPLYLLPSSSYLKHEPMGLVLIIAPWNYPFQLLMNPLIGAISAGNCAVLKPSEFCIHTNRVMENIIQQVFEPDHVTLFHGGKETNQALLAHQFDLIFFTGSPRLGKIVMKAAAETLTPVVLELGGKSPCIVDRSAKVDLAAKRIAWGKMVNLGQTCIAPDYLLVHEDLKDDLVSGIIAYWKQFFGEDGQQSEFLPRMVTKAAFDRVSEYLSQGKVIHGGKTDRDDQYISPTLMEDVSLDSPIMQDEIFGPILPIITFKNINEAIDLINLKEKPLAYYYFGETGKGRELLEQNTSGGVCINDTLIHISNHELPFGGVGNSGLGRYHGRYSFEAFSNARSIMKSPTWIDMPFRYPPFKYFNIVKKLLT